MRYCLAVCLIAFLNFSYSPAQAGRTINLLELVSTSVYAANEAGKIVREILNQGDLGIREKGENDLQTEADRSAQRFIIASLAKRFPDVAVVGEEEIEPFTGSQDVLGKFDDGVLEHPTPPELREVDADTITIYVDPLDSTNSYTQGYLIDVTVLIGIAINDKAVAGVIHQPFYNFKANESNPNEQLGRTMWGVVGLGAFGITKMDPPRTEHIVVTTRSHRGPINDKAVESLHPTQVLRVGGSGHKVINLIEGEAHVYVYASGGTKKWDTCAPDAILQAVGGKSTDIHGDELHYARNVDVVNRRGVLAALDEREHRSAVRSIPAEVKEALQ